jgi:iron-sulfur cluster assembly protein
MACLVVVAHVLDSSPGGGVQVQQFPRVRVGKAQRARDLSGRSNDCMLTITDTAAEAIKGIVASPQVPEGAGLRIATRPEGSAEGALEVSVAAVPAEDDQVVEESGAQVFLEPHAAEALDDKVLDAEIERGEVRFAVGEQT